MPRSDYDLDLNDFDFSFKFKKPGRGKSGKYTIVLANDAGETEKDIYVNFLGNFFKRRPLKAPPANPRTSLFSVL